jgi:hypothetical protein
MSGDDEVTRLREDLKVLAGAWLDHVGVGEPEPCSIPACAQCHWEATAWRILRQHKPRRRMVDRSASPWMRRFDDNTGESPKLPQEKGEDSTDS